MPEQHPYQNAALSVEARVDDLLPRMTLAEKVGQLMQVDGKPENEPVKWIQDYHIGSFLHVLGPTNNEFQKLAAETRLGIPLIFGIDAIHGHAFWPDAIAFPTQLALSCSWNADLVEQVGRVTAREVAATGAHWTFSPVLGTVRDLRWGRVDETFGEDPYLIGELGAAIVRGYQGDDLSAADSILACAKHYAGYSMPRGGRDSSEADLPKRYLRSLFLKPFKAAAEAGCGSFMAGYHAIDGVPCSANEWLLTQVLREEWGFDGFVVSDWDNIGYMHKLQMVSPTIEDAVQRALAAGNDMAMSTPEFYDAALAAVQNGDLDEAVIDTACRNILRVKFRMGLFDERRYIDFEGMAHTIASEEHKQIALEAAYESVVLLKNEGDLLPLAGDARRIAVIGPNADDVASQLGDWTSWQQRGDADGSQRPRDLSSTVLDGVKARAGAGVTVVYNRGCIVIDPVEGNQIGDAHLPEYQKQTGPDTIDEAAELAANSDLAIVVIGDDVSLNGEWRDRADLALTGDQEQLVQAVHATGTPTVVVLITGKPLCTPWIAENIPAILQAFNPGIAGGAAIAGLLFGDRSPQGKLTVSVARHVGQLPVFYNDIPGWHSTTYRDMTAAPLYPFGYGLSYATFAYSDLKVLTPELKAGETLRVQVDLQNTHATRAGLEIVQLYINDVFSSVTTPRKELQAFARVWLEPGKKQTVTLEVPYDRLALVNAAEETVVEPGNFEVMVGASSQDNDLLKAEFAVQ